MTNPCQLGKEDPKIDLSRFLSLSTLALSHAACACRERREEQASRERREEQAIGGGDLNNVSAVPGDGRSPLLDLLVAGMDHVCLCDQAGPPRGMDGLVAARELRRDHGSDALRRSGEQPTAWLPAGIQMTVACRSAVAGRSLRDSAKHGG